MTIAKFLLLAFFLSSATALFTAVVPRATVARATPVRMFRSRVSEDEMSATKTDPVRKGRQLPFLRMLRRRRAAVMAAREVCVPSGEIDNSQWPARRWYICSEPNAEALDCTLMDEEVPGFEGRQMWMCSIIDTETDLGEFYDEMMA